ncbi:hypothetical protein [Anaeromyxobacter dehalogenans]|uniref:hypothetical protein n=1 Tax=Anaeromyxobacter dehalogenans TaxID=161493 RepID=UPI0012ED8293|nr:hypothetical protein [Anaeromyxobacter dehalogenans]
MSRRRFMGACGVVVGAAMVPGSAAAVAAGAPATVAEAAKAWSAANEAMIARFRPIYMAELRRLAEDLRPLFESGELSTTFDIDDKANMAAHRRLERMCGDRFGAVVVEHVYENGGREWTGEEEEAARFVAAVSPSIEEEGPVDEWAHPGLCAQACAAHDVLDIARREGWGVRS